MKPFAPITLLACLLLVFSMGCDDDEMMEEMEPGMTNRVITGPNSPTAYNLDLPNYLPGPILDAENPLTDEGVLLGRKLFYDPILSKDSSMSCSSCHLQSLAFTDGLALSLGVEGLEGRRSAMSPVNMIFNPTGFNWDGSSEDLRD